MPFVVYNAATRVVTGAYRLSLEAATVAAADSDLTASAVDVVLPAEFNPGWYFTEGNALVPELPLSEAVIRLQWKQDLSQRAKMVDEAIKSHWANQTRRLSSWETVRSDMDALKLNNTFDWARLWVGLPWLEILKAEGDATALALEMVPGPPARHRCLVARRGRGGGEPGPSGAPQLRPHLLLVRGTRSARDLG